jgi:transmembrane 9 superfamily protein 1
VCTLDSPYRTSRGFLTLIRYSVSWKENKGIPFKKRHRMDHTFFPKTLEIHWLSMINSAVLVLLLVGFVMLILTRMLNKDFAQYAKGDDDDVDIEDDLEEEQGWKNLHTDVFRYPEYKSLLCAILGNGTQFIVLATGILFMALSGAFHVHHHGSMNTAAILIYAFTCGIAG